LWLQIHADVLGRAIYVPREGEACALGSALVAAVHSGQYSDFSEAATQMVQIAEEIEPDPAHKRVYDDHYGRYLATYPALKDLMHEIAESK
jgi:sugar (pentulose or hexulose) kinase